MKRHHQTLVFPSIILITPDPRHHTILRGHPHSRSPAIGSRVTNGSWRDRSSAGLHHEYDGKHERRGRADIATEATTPNAMIWY
jgi:hypothetical protein